jgi:hypothetical protein
VEVFPPADHPAVGCYALSLAPWILPKLRIPTDTAFSPPPHIELSREWESDYLGMTQRKYKLLPPPGPGGPSRHAVWVPVSRDSIWVVWSDSGWSGYEMYAAVRGDSLRGRLSYFSDLHAPRATRVVTAVRTPCGAAH